MSKQRLIFQLGTNNWQRGGEFAPGSGILHEAHHKTFNNLPYTASYSMYPSRIQAPSQTPDVHIFKLDHDIPICESISPTSSYRWHSMSEDEFDAYRNRLTEEVYAYMDQIEQQRQETFTLVIAHHTFLNPLVMSDVLRRRHQAGKPKIPLICFVHGTALKMYNHEKNGLDPEEYPLRFLSLIQASGIFDYARHSASPEHFGIDACVAISNQQVEALKEVFPKFPRQQVVVSPNGYDQTIFHPIIEPEDTYRQRDQVLARFNTVPHAGSQRPVEVVSIAGGFEKLVIFCGKFADWKRLDCLLHAASEYEKDGRIGTLVVGSGPQEEQAKMQNLAYDELGLRHVFFLGPRPQSELALLYSAADLGCFPSYNEPFGLVFIECMACGTPVIGANSGGPKDFVSAETGFLVPETEDKALLAEQLATVIQQALREDWKSSKGPDAADLAKNNYSVTSQCINLLNNLAETVVR